MFCFFVFINFYVNKLVFFYLFEYVKLKEYVCGKKFLIVEKLRLIGVIYMKLKMLCRVVLYN